MKAILWFMATILAFILGFVAIAGIAGAEIDLATYYVNKIVPLEDLWILDNETARNLKSNEQVKVTATGRDATGADWVRLQVELKPSEQFFQEEIRKSLIKLLSE